ncbi:hypothetical protein NQ152_00885 [Microbacterium sp. zg.B48]|uniref:hypothetical protein n=1 Tax=Microbacterium sp. zg.B48 TaxID=2969408 RepID=UPI00214C73A0|nr:hypothetical protein [Microbacterium sp. zg.B48]MCR2762055.1 hypothetical protein [Microbacterium sp. zg.B48]
MADSSSDGQSWTAINAAVLALLTDLDPYGLEPGANDGAPADEYNPEAAPMARHLIDHGRISDADVDVIWVRWFGEPLSTIDGNGFARFVADLNALVGSAA